MSSFNKGLDDNLFHDWKLFPLLFKSFDTLCLVSSFANKKPKVNPMSYPLQRIFSAYWKILDKNKQTNKQTNKQKKKKKKRCSKIL